METIPVKPGYQTTEFWLTVAAQVIGALLASGAIGDGTPLATSLGTIAMALSAAGYSHSRSVAKTK